MSTESSSFEFSEKQNVVIHDLAGGLQFVAIALAFGSVLLFVAGGVGLWISHSRVAFVASISLVTLSVLLGPSAWWTHRSSRAFDHVVNTRANDIAHLMNALDSLSRYFKFLRLLVVLALILVTLVLGGSIYLLERASQGASA